MEELRQARENRVTYPSFMSSVDGALIFTYRDGASGNGSQLWNVYDPDSQTWKRFLDVPMFDGLGKCNAYFKGPVKGPDGWYHIAWVWRDTPDCATNHDLSYMRSRDLIHWENSQGKPLTLPVTEQTGEVVAPLKNGEGLFNPLVQIGFDTQNRVVLTYTRYDENMNNQIMQARLENGVWKYYQTTDWTHSWVFSGGGCIPGELSFSAVRPPSRRQASARSPEYRRLPAYRKAIRDRGPASDPIRKTSRRCTRNCVPTTSSSRRRGRPGSPPHTGPEKQMQRCSAAHPSNCIARSLRLPEENTIRGRACVLLPHSTLSA